MNYSELSDFEINRKVLAIKSGLKPLSYAHDADKRSAGVRDKNDLYHWYDFCNSWADAGPIIEKHRIAIEPSKTNEKWAAQAEDWNYASSDKNPLRAAMVVYLLMHDKGEE